MMLPYFYQVFGLKVNSEIVIPEWEEISPLDDIDVTIQSTDRFSLIDQVIVDKGYFQINQQQYTIDIGGIAKFSVNSGKSILFQAYEGADELHILLFLQSRIMSVLLFQRDIIPLSACSIKLNDKCVLLTGNSIYSTKILPSWYQKKHHDAVLTTYLTPISPNREIASGYHYMGEKANSRTQSFNTLTTIIDLDAKDTSTFDIQEIEGMEKFNLLKDNIDYKEVLLQLNFKAVFHSLNDVLKHTDFYRITIPKKNFSFNQLINQINKIVYDQ